MSNIRIKNIAILLVLILNFFVETTTACFYSNDKYATDTWYHRCINTQEAWDLIDSVITEPRERVIIASIDTGVDFSNSDLDCNFDKVNPIRITNGEILEYGKPKFSHGTGIGCITAATSNNGIGTAGVGSGNKNNIISYLPINVANESLHVYSNLYHRFKATTTDDIILGLDYAVEKGARIIHMCLGHTSKFWDSNLKYFDTVKLCNHIKEIQEENPNIVFIASAGNRNTAGEWYPSDCPGVISCINTKQFTNIYSNVKAKTSSYGNKKTISAPGCTITCREEHLEYDDGCNEQAINEKYYFTDSTSACSAVVAGVVALVVYANPTLTADEVKDVLCSTTVDLYKTGYDEYTGWGNINAYNAVAKALKLAGYSEFQDTITLPEGPRSIRKIKFKRKKNNKVQLKWKKIKVSNGYINQYRIYVSKKRHGKYKRVAVLSSNKNQYTYKLKKKRKKYYFIILPYGTTEDGKKLVPQYRGPVDAVKFRYKR